MVDLSVLYEISTLPFAPSQEEVAQEAMRRAVRLFGLRRFALFLGAGKGCKLAVFHGFKNSREIKGAIKQRSPNQFHFRLGEGGELGKLFMEKVGAIHERERQVYTIFARQLERVLAAVKANEQYRRALQELKESEARFRALVEQSLVGIYIDSMDRFLYVNEAVCKIFGYRPEELMGRISPLELVHPEDRPMVEEKMRKRLQGEIEYARFVFRGLRKDGSVIFCEVFGRVTELQGQRVIIGTVVDITERRKVYEALKESEKKYRELTEEIHDVIYAVDEKGVITYISPAVERIGGWSPEELVGRPFTDLVLQEERKALEEAFLRTVQEPLHQNEFRAFTRSGDIRWVQVVSRPIVEGGRIVGRRGVLRDVTERKRLEDALRRSFMGTAEAFAKLIEERDPYTSGHSLEVARLAVAIGREMGFTEKELTGLYFSGLLHDIGKIAVPIEILLKPGPLTELERALIRRHPEAGYEVLKGVEFPWPVALATLQHHERMDGSGYPQGLRGKEIIREARILAVADVIDAMTHHRPYRPARPLEEALEEITRHKGLKYDPDIVDACVKSLTRRSFKFRK